MKEKSFIEKYFVETCSADSCVHCVSSHGGSNFVKDCGSAGCSGGACNSGDPGPDPDPDPGPDPDPDPGGCTCNCPDRWQFVGSGPFYDFYTCCNGFNPFEGTPWEETWYDGEGKICTCCVEMEWMINAECDKVCNCIEYEHTGIMGSTVRYSEGQQTDSSFQQITCACVDYCTDGVQDCEEAGIDCEDPAGHCGPCACNTNADCDDGNSCTQDVCVTPGTDSCTNTPWCSGAVTDCGCEPPCKDCASLYGTACGYDGSADGLCSCGLAERPSWSCDGTDCKCSCAYDVSCGVTENCCNAIDDDGINGENGADSACQNDRSLVAGNNSVCWWTEWDDYSNDADYYSGWYSCPADSIVETVNIHQNTECGFLNLFPDNFYVYDSGDNERYKDCGNIGSKDIDMTSYNTQEVRFKLTSSTWSGVSDGVQVNTITCSTPPDPCECSSGDCCSDGCNFDSSSTVCNSFYDTDYGCPDGTDCGDDVSVKYKVQYCSGSSSSCNGTTSGWGGWSLQDDCDSTEICADNDSTCNYDAACAGMCSSDADCDDLDDCTYDNCPEPLGTLPCEPSTNYCTLDDETNCGCEAGDCKDCSDTYGEACGYDGSAQGFCVCNVDEKPVWSCNGTDCECACGYDAACVVDVAPVARISCNPASCVGYLKDNPSFNNDSTDANSTNSPDMNNDIKKSKWYVDGVRHATYSGADTMNSFFPGVSGLSVGTQAITLGVIDKKGLLDSDRKDFTVKQDAKANFMCSVDEVIWQNCASFVPRILYGQKIYFKDDSTVSEDASNISLWVWMQYVPATTSWEVFESLEPLAELRFTGNTKILLTILDDVGRSDSQEYTVGVKAMSRIRFEETKPPVIDTYQ